jgi:hypothetical protein
MTTKKDLKQLIRQRMAKTGESYTLARRHVLGADQKLCPACSVALEERTVREMPDLDGYAVDDLTEGQAADYFQALDSDDPSDWGDWADDVMEKFCPKCEARRAMPLELLLRARRRSGVRRE